MLGDVSGAGLGAGLDMVAVQSFLRAQFAHDADPAHAAASLNAHLYARAGGGRFVTLWLGVFDRDAGECRFVDAGHGHALRVTHAAATPLAAGGDIPLGIEARVDFHAERLAFAAGDLLLLYSDGAVEQESPQGESFGLEALVEAVRGADHPSRAIERMLTALRDHTAGAPPDDDTTLLALAWTDSEV
jgi:sigma-B regulation protein RsbU (phosphoserine phosphatase)